MSTGSNQQRPHCTETLCHIRWWQFYIVIIHQRQILKKKTSLVLILDVVFCVHGSTTQKQLSPLHIKLTSPRDGKFVNGMQGYSKRRENNQAKFWKRYGETNPRAKFWSRFQILQNMDKPGCSEAQSRTSHKMSGINVFQKVVKRPKKSRPNVEKRSERLGPSGSRLSER